MIEQYSTEWFTQRMGKITSSTIYNLMVEPKLKSEAGNLAATTKDYLTSKLAERLTGVQREFTSNATNHGLELENEAIKFYEGKTGTTVKSGGYIEMTDVIEDVVVAPEAVAEVTEEIVKAEEVEATESSARTS